MHPVDSLPPLESRVASLETSLRRSRLVASTLALALLLVVAAAFVPQAQEEVSTRRLVLTDAQDEPVVALTAGQQGSLVIESPTGEELFRLGGSPARRITH